MDDVGIDVSVAWARESRATVGWNRPQRAYIDLADGIGNAPHGVAPGGGRLRPFLPQISLIMKVVRHAGLPVEWREYSTTTDPAITGDRHNHPGIAC